MIDDDVSPAVRRAHLWGAVGLLVLLLAGVAWFAAYASAFVAVVADTLRDFPPGLAARLLLEDLAELLAQGASLPAMGPLAMLALLGAGLGVTVMAVVWLAALRLSFVWMMDGLMSLRQDPGHRLLPPAFHDPQAIAAKIGSRTTEAVVLTVAESLLAGPRGQYLRPQHWRLAKSLLRPASTLLRSVVRPVFYAAFTLAVLATLILVTQPGLPDPQNALAATLHLLSNAGLQQVMIWIGVFLATGVLTALYDIAFMRALLPRAPHKADPYLPPDLPLRRMGSFEQFKLQLDEALSGPGRDLILRHHVLSDSQTGRASFADHNDVRLSLLIEGHGRVNQDHTDRAAARRVLAGVALLLLAIALVFFVLPSGIIRDLLSGIPVAADDIVPGVLHLVLTLALVRRLWTTGNRFRREGAEVLDIVWHETPVALLNLVGTVSRNVRRGLDARGESEIEQQGQLLSLTVAVKATTLSSHPQKASGQREPWSSSVDESSRELADWLRGMMRGDAASEGPAAAPAPRLISEPPRPESIPCGPVAGEPDSLPDMQRRTSI